MEIEILLKMAIKLLYIKDSYLLEINVNERTITHRLAMYLQMLFTDYDVDCEYNRDFRDKKNIKFTQEEVEKMLSEIKAPFKEKIKKFLEEDNEDYLECSVYPDIIIHKRNSNNNLLAIEVKKQYSNEKDDKFDDQKLKKYTHGDGFGYKYGAFIKLGKSCEEIDIIWYKNGMPYNYNINPGDCIMNIKIREALFNDYKSISILVKEVHSLHVKNRPDVYADVENPFTEERFKEILSDGKTKVFVAENSNNEIIAYSIIEIMTTRNVPILKERKFVYIDDLYVNSNHRRKGVGRMLFRHIVDYAKKSGHDALELTVWEFNSDAIKFYESLGMTTKNRRMELKI